MIPDVGTTCLFSFAPGFEALDGIYKVRAETTFNNAIASGVDFVETLYIPAGLDKDDFALDYASYQDDRVLVLESVVNATVVYYTPTKIFDKVPDPTIREYLPLVLVVDLGVQRNPQAVLPVIDGVKDMVQSALGTHNPVRLITNPEDKIYLTDVQYAALVAARQSSIQELVPVSVQLHQEQAKNTILAAKLAAYEALIVQLSTLTPTPTPTPTP